MEAESRVSDLHMRLVAAHEALKDANGGVSAGSVSGVEVAGQVNLVVEDGGGVSASPLSQQGQSNVHAGAAGLVHSPSTAHLPPQEPQSPKAGGSQVGFPPTSRAHIDSSSEEDEVLCAGHRPSKE